MQYDDEWFNDESFWQYFAPIMFDNKRWAEVSPVLDAITDLAQLNQYDVEHPQNVPCFIDVCCGPGRITTEAARRGFDVTGVDITKSYLDAAYSDAKSENLDVSFINCDVRNLAEHEELTNRYDIAVNLYNSFGYFKEDSDNFLFLRNVYKALKNGGTFIMEVLGKEIAVRDFIETEWFTHSGYKVLTEYKPLDSWTRLQNRWILLDDRMPQGQRPKIIERTFTQRLYAASELSLLFFGAGFIQVDIYGAWDKSPYDQNAETLIIVGRK
ncbi:MAG: class I SAM-dependent methyltransferase [Termitinemataceae bacterium]|nr:MAG: class I SAM-dependent methyltransferase [Termitinemataceae bacterium]